MRANLEWWGYRACLLAQPLVRAIRPLKGAERLPLPPPRDLGRLLVGRRPPRREAVAFAVCAQYYNEARYLREWIDFHRLMGAERFFLYDNESTDDHEQVLAPYEEAGIVVRHPWPGRANQRAAYGDCLVRHRDEARWIAFIDLDEFVFSLDGRSLPAALEPVAEYPGVALSWVAYGPDGHETPPDAPLIWAYQRRAADDDPDNLRVKSIVDPARTIPTAPGDTHHFHYTAGFAVDIEGQMTYGAQHDGRPPRLDKVRVNHYWSKSLSELEERHRRKSAVTGGPRYGGRKDLTEVLERVDRVHDDAAVRAVKAAVAQRPGVADWLARDPAG